MNQNSIRIFFVLFLIFSFFSSTQAGQAPTAVPNSPSDVYVERGTNQLIVTKPGGIPAKYVIKGVTWSPATRAPKKGVNPADFFGPKIDYGFFFDWTGRNPQGHDILNFWLKNEISGYALKDIPMMRMLNANTVRIYHSLGSRAEDYNNVAFQLRTILDEFYRNGIMVVMTVAMSKEDFEGASPRYLKVVQSFKNHPAILMWAIGNEWNFNKLYNDDPKTSDTDKYWQAIDMVDQAARKIKEIDRHHPVCSILGDQLGKVSDITPYILYFCYNVDVWGFNVYRGKTLTNLPQQYKDAWRWFRVPAKPYFISEFGIDSYRSDSYSTSSEGGFTRAYNVKGGKVEGAQAEYDRSIWWDIIKHLSIGSSDEYCLGGLVHEFNDELWKSGNYTVGLGGLFDYNDKDKKHSYDDYDDEGFTWAGAPFDKVMNEEHFGLVNADRKPKVAYDILKQDWDNGYFSGRADYLAWYWEGWRIRSGWQALKNANVYIYSVNNFYKTTTTDSNGNIKLMSLPQGSYWVIIYSPRGQWQYKFIQIKKDQYTQERFYLN